ncbi:Xylulose kinase 2 [Linum perenne]
MSNPALPPGSLFLGFDSSTQSLKATVLNSDLNVVKSEQIHFDTDLPHYKTKDGIYRDPSDSGRIVSPTLMWVEALDLILQRLTKSGLEFGKVAALSGSGQQHGSVYWKKGSSAIFSSLESGKPLADQFRSAFSLSESPIWMDSSTTAQCREIEEAVGGPIELARITGSRGYERFTGPQIKKIFQTQPQVYNDTERISLVSSFLASIFAGKYACIDHADGAGMNLMDIQRKAWSKLVLEAIAPGLEEKLGELAPAYAVVGSIAPYFVDRYKFDKSCLVVHWSGDNPNSLAGLTLSVPGDLGISLGTSDTVIGISSDPKPGLEGHVFPNPVDAKGYMVMLCYKNGSLTREGGKLGYYYKDHEILPPLPIGCHRYILQNFTGDTLEGLSEQEVKEFDPASEVRAIIEGQFLSMRGHAERFGMPVPPKRIIATGGASTNHSLLKSIASIFGCGVYTVQRPDSASLGAALRAAHGWMCEKKGSFVPIASMYSDKLEKSSLSCNLTAGAGSEEVSRKYGVIMKKRIEIEKQLVEKLGR